MRRLHTVPAIGSGMMFRELFGYFLLAQKVTLEPLAKTEVEVMKEKHLPCNYKYIKTFLFFYWIPDLFRDDGGGGSLASRG